MDFDDNASEPLEIGSDELLSADDLRLPEGANILVRVHAVKAWLTRRQDEMKIAIGETALLCQEILSNQPDQTFLRRRERIALEERIAHIQQRLTEAETSLEAYEEAQALLEECIAHTSGERVLVEYYLTLEDLIEQRNQQDSLEHETWQVVFSDVQHRIEHVGIPQEE